MREISRFLLGLIIGLIAGAIAGALALYYFAWAIGAFWRGR